jgi:hypothetical protein
MSEHYTSNTVSAWEYCPRCRKLTKWPVYMGRACYCMECTDTRVSVNAAVAPASHGDGVRDTPDRKRTTETERAQQQNLFTDTRGDNGNTR